MEEDDLQTSMATCFNTFYTKVLALMPLAPVESITKYSDLYCEVLKSSEVKQWFAIKSFQWEFYS